MDGGDWISITEAAERLTSAGDPIDRSTLSRYLKQHAEALPQRREGKANLVEFGALVAHRSENVRLRRPVVPAGTVPVAVPGQPVRFAGSQSDGAARKAQADAALKELDLGERLGQLTVVSEVDKGGRNAIALMDSAFDRAIDTCAATASVKYGWDERMVRLVLKDFARKGREIFHAEMLTLLDEIARPKRSDE